ncbi:DMT family transporter [Brevibacillus borstelensis]|uniref:DMT family transporter n=1 Tax=Brevibacillus borstelensis TaxID=45462 RepID=UPI0030ED6BF3
MIVKGSWEAFSALAFNAGALLFLAALFCWALYGLIGKAVMKGVSPLLTTTVTTLTGAFFLVILSLAKGGWDRVPSLSGQSWGEMIYLTFFATILAFFLWNQGIHQLGASQASIYMNLVPINACWIAVLFYGSSMTGVQGIGIILVIAGVCTVTLSNGKKAARHPSKIAERV